MTKFEIEQHFFTSAIIEVLMSLKKEKPSGKARVARSRPVFVLDVHGVPNLGTTGGACTKEEKVRRVFEKTGWANFAYRDPLGDHA